MRSSSNLPDVDLILVPIGGGGLAAGVSTLAKQLNPNVKVIGVEPSGAASMKAIAGGGTCGDAGRASPPLPTAWR